MNHVFAELSLIIVITAAVSLFMKLIRQPLILGYILSGLLVGPAVFDCALSPIHTTASGAPIAGCHLALGYTF